MIMTMAITVTIKRKDEGRLTLHKEELDINKNRVHKGEVELGKEIIEEQKQLMFPLLTKKLLLKEEH